MKANHHSSKSRTSFKRVEDIKEDAINDELYGLFLKVKDSPRHIGIKPENLFNEVYGVCDRISHDKSPEEHLDIYAKEIEQDMGWHYAVDLVMTMVYNVIRLKKKETEKNKRILSAIEHTYQHNCYWQPFLNVQPRRADLAATILQLKRQLAKKKEQPIVIQVGDANINLYSGGNIIGNTIKYGNE